MLTTSMCMAVHVVGSAPLTSHLFSPLLNPPHPLADECKGIVGGSTGAVCVVG